MAAQQGTNMGRRKIEIRRRETKEARQVCFSNRRAGLFNKANELAILCGAQVAAVAFSPGGKAFSFGHPSVESVLGRLGPPKSPEAQDAVAVGGGADDRNQALEEVNQELGDLRPRQEAAKARGEAAEEALAKTRAEVCQTQAAVWVETDVNQMVEEDLVAFEAVLAKVLAAVPARSDRRRGDGGGGFELGGTSGELGRIEQQQMMADDGDAVAAAAGMEMMPHGHGPHGFPH